MNGIRREIFYAWKGFWSVVSGFHALQYRDGNGDWQYIVNGTPDNPYYVCALFYNGRHLPLPFFAHEDVQISWIQNLAIKFAAKINPGSYLTALEYCAWYDHDWREQNSTEGWIDEFSEDNYNQPLCDFIDPSGSSDPNGRNMRVIRPEDRCPNCGTVMNGNEVVQECPSCGYGTEEFDHRNDDDESHQVWFTESPGGHSGFE